MKLERHLSSSRSRRSIKPVVRESKDESVSSDSDGPGAVGEDFFTPPARPVGQQRATAAAGSELTDLQSGYSGQIMLQQPHQAAPGGRRMSRQATDTSLPAQSASPTGLGKSPSHLEASEHQQWNNVEPHLHNAMTSRPQVTDKDLVEKSVVRHCQVKLTILVENEKTLHCQFGGHVTNLTCTCTGINKAFSLTLRIPS